MIMKPSFEADKLCNTIDSMNTIKLGAFKAFAGFHFPQPSHDPGAGTGHRCTPYLYLHVGHLQMNMICTTLTAGLFLGIAASLFAKEPETLSAAGGQKIVKEFYDSGIIKYIKRYGPDGALIGILHHNEQGGATYADMYDGPFLAGKIYYYPNGQPHIEEHFDIQGAKRIERRFDKRGKLISEPK